MPTEEWASQIAAVQQHLERMRAAVADPVLMFDTSPVIVLLVEDAPGQA